MQYLDRFGIGTGSFPVPSANSAPQSSYNTSNTNMIRAGIDVVNPTAPSGMIQDTKTHFRSQIPCLGGIPVIGLAFQQNDPLDTKKRFNFLYVPILSIPMKNTKKSLLSKKSFLKIKLAPII